MAVVARETRVVPVPPEGLGEYAVEVWHAFLETWVSDAVIVEADGERLRHWIYCVDERNKNRELLRKNPLIKGSHGQLMLNPLHRRERDLTRDIERAEEHFGMTPLARWRLQLTVSEAGRSQNELRKSLLSPVKASVDADGVIDLDAL